VPQRSAKRPEKRALLDGHGAHRRSRIRPPRSSSSTSKNNEAPELSGPDGFGYTVFGKVIKGQEVVDKIKGVLVDDVKGSRTCRSIPIVISRHRVLVQKR
jgi:peptidyl-prolyl cis-trans isomerase A (cyclophilin A)